MKNYRCVYIWVFYWRQYRCWNRLFRQIFCEPFLSQIIFKLFFKHFLPYNHKFYLKRQKHCFESLSRVFPHFKRYTNYFRVKVNHFELVYFRFYLLEIKIPLECLKPLRNMYCFFSRFSIDMRTIDVSLQIRFVHLKRYLFGVHTFFNMHVEMYYKQSSAQKKE